MISEQEGKNSLTEQFALITGFIEFAPMCFGLIFFTDTRAVRLIEFEHDF